MTLKLIAGLLVLIVVAVGVLSLTGRKEYRAEIAIAAPPEQVWAVLIDTAAYGEWNPVFVQVDGKYEVGARVTNHVQPPEGDVIKIENKVLDMESNRRLRQTGGVTGIITFDHTWTLEPVEGGTRVTQYEVDRGAYVWFWDDSWVQPSYERVNEALQKRVLAKNS